jgi:predicted dehydrogenase
VAGAGSAGSRHVENLQGLGVRDLALYRATFRESALQDVPVERDLDAALRGRPLAALVCNATALHVPVALAAARAGAHVFLEKPVSHSLDGVAELAHEARARGLTIMVGFQFRFHPALRQVKAWVEEGAVGEVVSARARWGEYLPLWHPGEDYRLGYSARQDLGGGAVLTLSHPFDYLRWLVGEVVAVSAETVTRSGLGIEVEDAAEVLLHFESGALGSVSLDYVAQPPCHVLEVVGQRGLIRWSDPDGAARLHRGTGGSARYDLPPGFTRNAMFVEEMRHFLACVRGEATPACGFEDGVRALKIALAAKRSAREGRRIAV